MAFTDVEHIRKPILDEMRVPIPDISERFTFSEVGLPISIEIEGEEYEVESSEIEIPGSIFFKPDNPELSVYRNQLRDRYTAALIRDQAFTNERHLYQYMRIEGGPVLDRIYDEGEPRESLGVDFTRMLVDAQKVRMEEFGDNRIDLMYARYLHARAQILGIMGPAHELRLRDVYYKSVKQLNKLSERENLEEAMREVEALFEVFAELDVPIIQRTLVMQRPGRKPISIKRYILGDYPRRQNVYKKNDENFVQVHSKQDSWDGAELGAVVAIHRAEKRLNYVHNGKEIVIHTLGNLNEFVDQYGHVLEHHQPGTIDYAVDENPRHFDTEKRIVPLRDTTELVPVNVGNEETRRSEILRHNMGMGGRGFRNYIALMAGRGTAGMMRFGSKGLSIFEPEEDVDELYISMVEFDLPTELERRTTLHEIAHMLDRNLYSAALPHYEGFAVAFEFDYNFELLKDIKIKLRSDERPVDISLLKALFESQPPDRKRWGNSFSKTQLYYVSGAFMAYLHNHFSKLDTCCEGLAGRKLQEFYDFVSRGKGNNFMRGLNQVFGNEQLAGEFVEEFIERINC